MENCCYQQVYQQALIWGLASSFAFVAEPQTNGVAKRFYKTLKEQVIYGRNYRTVEEVRTAVADFMDPYNRLWLIEKKPTASLQ